MGGGDLAGQPSSDATQSGSTHSPSLASGSPSPLSAPHDMGDTTSVNIERSFTLKKKFKHVKCFYGMERLCYPLMVSVMIKTKKRVLMGKRCTFIIRI